MSDVPRDAEGYVVLPKHLEDQLVEALVPLALAGLAEVAAGRDPLSRGPSPFRESQWTAVCPAGHPMSCIVAGTPSGFEVTVEHEIDGETERCYARQFRPGRKSPPRSNPQLLQDARDFAGQELTRLLKKGQVREAE